MLDTFLWLNLEWTKQVGDWERCRTMSVRIIAVRDINEPRDLARCVTGPINELELGLIQGSVPVPLWGKRHGHTQQHIDRIVESVCGFDGARDLGLDAHNDSAWACTGGPDQNRAPSGVSTDVMVGFRSDDRFVGQFEDTSSESDHCDEDSSHRESDFDWSMIHTRSSPLASPVDM